MKTMYRVGATTITELQILKETPKMVVYIDKWDKECRELKESAMANWFESEEEAVELMRKRLGIKLEKAKNGLAHAQRLIKKLNEEYPIQS